MTRRRLVLYLALVAAAVADVVTRGLMPASIPDVSPWVNAVGFGTGFAVLKATILLAVIAGAELIRRLPNVAGTAPLVPVISCLAWTIGALSNVARLTA